MESPILQGRNIRLEPLEQRHIDGLVAAAGDEGSLYQWSPVPRGKAEATSYIETALEWRNAGSAVPFAIVRVDGGIVIGSTRFFNLERWSWPPGHPSYVNAWRGRSPATVAGDAGEGARATQATRSIPLIGRPLRA